MTRRAYVNYSRHQGKVHNSYSTLDRPVPVHKIIVVPVLCVVDLILVSLRVLFLNRLLFRVHQCIKSPVLPVLIDAYNTLRTAAIVSLFLSHVSCVLTMNAGSPTKHSYASHPCLSLDRRSYKALAISCCT